MAKANPIQPSVTAGEFGPRMAARVDFAKYQSAAATVQNMIILPQGGLSRRPATRYIAELKSSAARSRLISFEYSITQAYTIEAGNNYFRFYRNQARIEVADTDAAITNGTFTSNITGWDDISTGTGSIAHDATNGRLSLDSDAAGNEGIAEQDVTVGASFQDNEHVIKFRVIGAPGDTIQLRIGTSSGDDDILDELQLEVGWHAIPFTPGATTFYVQFINDTLSKIVQIDDVSLIDDSAVEIGTPYATADVTATLLHYAQNANELYISHPDYPIYRLQRLGDSSWSLIEVLWDDGPYLDLNPTSTTFTASATTGKGVTVTASSLLGVNRGLGFQSTDVGRLVRIQHTTTEPGWGVITSITSALVAVVDVKRAFNATTASARWNLGAWSGTTGYPRTVCFFEQRFVAAGTEEQPQTIWLSQSADIENMRPDSFVSSAVAIEDDDALTYTIAADQVNAIFWLSPGKELVIGTAGGEWILDSDGPVVTSTDVVVRRQTTHGCAAIQPVRIGHVVLFVQRAARKVREFTYNFDVDSFIAPDMTLLADHILRGGVEEIAFQEERDSILWAVRSDGVLCAMTYKREQDVIGWGRQILGGSFGAGNAVVESVTVIPGEDDEGQIAPSGGRDEVWLIVKRTINGQTKRYVEVLEGMWEGPIRHDYDSDADWKTAILADQPNQYYADSIITYDGTATSTISGLDHLEGETVKILADGSVHPDREVSGGEIELDGDYSVVQVGLGYTHRFRSLKLAVGGTAGTAVGKTKIVNRVGLILLDSTSYRIGATDQSADQSTIEFREVADLMDTAVPMFTGERIEEFKKSNWLTDPRIVIEGDAPAAFTMLAMLPEVDTNDAA